MVQMKGPEHARITTTLAVHLSPSVTACVRLIDCLRKDRRCLITAWLTAATVMTACTAPPGDIGREWPFYGGDAGAMKYSPLASIDTSNVARLRLAWEWTVGERAIAETDSTRASRPGTFQATPLMIGDTLFLSTPYNRVVALNAATGEPYWEHETGAQHFGQPSNGTGFVHRGVATWTDGTERRIFIASRWRLVALDASTGDPVRSFGDTGVVDLTGDLIWNVNKLHYTNTSPPVVFDDLVIVGNGVGDRLTYRNDPPGDIQAYDVRTGARVWRFSPIPRPGEFGHETWEDSSWAHVGHTNVWAPFTVDAERGLLFLPVSTPSNDFYGGHRKGDNLFAEALLVLNARTGQRAWHFQTVRHGVWDYDLPAAPMLIPITVGGRDIDAVVQLGKTGFAYVFDRANGEPVWPIEDRAVPASDVPGERTAATQPFPTLPEPFARQGFTEDDLLDFTPQLRTLARDAVRPYRMGPMFTPPSLGGTILMPGLIGGAGWGGGAYDPGNGTLYVKATNWPYRIAVRPPEPSDTIQGDYALARPLNLGIPGETLAREYGLSETPDDLPVHKPPYGTLTAIRMETGRLRWQSTVGDTPDVRNHPVLRDLNLPPLGVSGSPGPIVTGGGLVFVSGGGSVLYAYHKERGDILWQVDLGSSAYAVPMTYATSDGTQFVVIATGSGDNAVLKAFALGNVS
jgi:quinoprotein glucose dehydrogenase